MFVTPDPPRRRSRSARSSLLRVAAGAVLVVACGRPARLYLQEAREAMRRASEAGGVTRAPEVCAAAQAALVRAEAEAAVQAKRSFLSRDAAEPRRLSLQALFAAQDCATHATFARDRARRRAERSLDELQAAIRRSAVLARHVADGADLKTDLLEAEISLGEGRSSYAHGQYERAEDAAARGHERVAAAADAINQFLDAYQTNPHRSAWRRMVLETLRESRRGGRPVILVDKLRRQLLLMKGDEEIGSYAVDLGAAGIDSKTRAGDDATPEGRYRITEVRGPGQTHFYRALMLDYPNAEDRARFRRLQRAGQIPRGQGIGSLIEIHGQGGRARDWTQGCVALDNDDMDDLADRVAVGTAVTIVGTIPEGTLP
jgi:lipoprotein-anchoring transpeptidase ErfK/SrfK